MSFDDKELEELRRRKLAELQAALAKKKEEEERKAAEALREAILRRYLTAEARARLSNVKLVRPELALQVENYIIALAQSGRLTRPLTEEDIKELLGQLTEERKETRIRIKEKGW